MRYPPERRASIVAPAPRSQPKAVGREVSDFLRTRSTPSPARAAAMRGRLVAGMSAAAAAVVIGGVASGCTATTDDQPYGFALAETTTTTMPPQVIGMDVVRGRYTRWERVSEKPLALLLKGADGGDGYEINWYTDTDAPIPIPGWVAYGDAPPGTEFGEDVFGNPYPIDPAVAEALTVSNFRVSSMELQSPPGTTCVDIEYRIPGQDPKPAGSFIVDPSARRDERVENLLQGRTCPDGPKSVVDVPVREIGPSR